MKSILLSFFLLLTCHLFSQSKLTAYIEVRGYVDLMGNINLDELVKPRKMTKADSLVDFKQLKENMYLGDALRTVNKLSELGWSLISVTNVSQDKEGRPNSAFILYYFKKEFDS